MAWSTSLFGARYTDLCYGYNAFWAKHLSELDLDCDGFEIETVMNVRAAKAGLAIQEIPSYEHLRLHGMSNLKVVATGYASPSSSFGSGSPVAGVRPAGRS